MKFYFKITTWEVVEVNDCDETFVFNEIKAGRISSSNDVYNTVNGARHEIVLDSEVTLTPEKNDGESTIDVEDANGEKIYSNVAPSIGAKDVIRIALAISMPISRAMIQKTIERYPAEALQDPSATWDLIVEKIINDLNNE